jgi:hypothetical protein
MSGLLCAGDVYIDREDANGDPTGLKLLGNTTKFEIAETVEKKERVSKGKSDYGTVLDAVYLKQASALAIGCDEFDGQPLQFALLGDQEDHAVTGGTIANQDVFLTTAYWSELGKEDVSALVVTGDGTGPTYTLGTDFEYNEDLGLIRALEGGALDPTGATCDVDFTYATTSGIQISAGIDSLIKARLILDGINKANGRKVRVYIPRCALGPNAAIDFKADDFSGIELQGSPELVDGSRTDYGADEDAAYYVRYLD